MTDKKWEQASHDLGDLRREMQEGHGGRLVNMIVGLIINANDAYERSGNVGKRVIRVDVDRTKTKRTNNRQGKARIRVIDWAHGMDYNDFGTFSAYGGAKSRWEPGTNISGLFGREASDIMWSNVGSRYLSIKNGKGYACEFRPTVQFQRYELDRRVTRQFEREFKVEPGNFMLSEFYLDENYPLSPYDHLVHGLKNHFRLRLINADPSIEVHLHYSDSKGNRKPQLLSFTPLETKKRAELLSEKSFELQYQDYPPFAVEGRLFRSLDRELTQSGPEREGGILVYADDGTVMELSLFGFDDGTYSPYVGRLFGYLKLNVADILRKELREADHLVALIEVDRSQLRRRTEFYETLKKCAEAWLKPWVDAERERTALTRAVEVTDGWNRKLRPLFAEINRVIHQKTGQAGAQVKGAHGSAPQDMEFSRTRVLASVGTVYRLDLLCNTNAIPPGSRVILESDNPRITVEPSQDTVPEPNHALEDVARIVVRVSATLEGEHATVTATVPGYAHASLSVESIEADVYFPHEGIEWWPDSFEAVAGVVGHPTLWVDLTRVNDDDLIHVSCPTGSVEVLDHQITPTSVRVLKEDPTTGIRIGKVRPRFIANGQRGQGLLEAAWENLHDTLTFDVVDPHEPQVRGNWTFSGIDFESGPVEMDVYPTPEGKIMLNVQHPLISSYFGTSSEEAVNTVGRDANSRRLAAHLVVDCILNDLSRKAWRNEHGPNANMEIGTRDPTRMDYQVYNYVMRLKAQYGAQWVQSLVAVLGS